LPRFGGFANRRLHCWAVDAFDESMTAALRAPSGRAPQPFDWTCEIDRQVATAKMLALFLPFFAIAFSHFIH
jgi:hypothetical protein